MIAALKTTIAIQDLFLILILGLFCLGFQYPIKHFLYTFMYKLLNLLHSITSSFSCKIFPKLICCLLLKGMSQLYSVSNLQTLHHFIYFLIYKIHCIFPLRYFVLLKFLYYNLKIILPKPYFQSDQTNCVFPILQHRIFILLYA